MPATNMLDDVANDLALWIDNVSTDVAAAFAATHSPFSANVTEEQKLEFYKQRLFNQDGSPNAQGRQMEMERLGSDGFAQVFKAVVRRWPELKAPEAPPIEVPDEWPQMPPAGPGGPPGAPGAPPGFPGGPPGIPGGPPPGAPGMRTPFPGPPPGVVPRPMASGGIVTEPTLALIGEAGPEAVVPLADYQYRQANYYPGGEQLAAGNIDLNNRPVVQNPDGSYSTVRSMSFGDENGREVLVPTVGDQGQMLSNQEAIDNYYNTGRHLGIFSTPDAATAYAQQLHQQQEQRYAPPPPQYAPPIVNYTERVQPHWGIEGNVGGTDMWAPAGTPIQSMYGGQVLESGYDPAGGNAVLVRGDDGRQYYYAHMQQQPLVRVGDTIQPGAQLGTLGDTGVAKGHPHLHLGVGQDIHQGTDAYGGTGTDYDLIAQLQDIYGQRR